MTIPFTNAKILTGGYDFSGQHNQISLEYEAEALDETAFGDTTRKMRGGLKTARVSGGGYFQAGTNKVDPILFEQVDLTEVVIMIAPETIAEGSTSTGYLYGMKADLMSYSPMGQGVGEIQAFTYEALCRGV